MGNPWLFIEEGTDITAVNPDLSIESGVSAPTPTQPGPDRITIWVPMDEETIINLGEHFPGPAPHTIDAGISGRTIRHVHLHAMGDEDDGEVDHKRTIVRLGLPTVSVEARDVRKSARQIEVETELANLNIAQISAYVGLGLAIGPFAAWAADEDVGDFNQNRTDLEDELRRLEEERLRAGEGKQAIGTVIPHVHRDFGGYSVLTRGTAAQEAREAHLIVSNENDVRAVGQTSVSIGSPGDVFIIADQQADMTSLCGFDSDPASRPFSYWNDRFTTGLTLAVGLATTIYSDVLGWWRVVEGSPRKPTEGAPGWTPTMPDPAFRAKQVLLNQMGLGGAKTAFAVWGMADFASGASDQAGAGAEPRGELARAVGFGSRLGAYSSGSLKIVADKNAGISSKFYTSLSADMGFASVSSAFFTSLTSTLWADLSSTWTSISGKKDVDIEAQLGSTTIRSRQGIEISSNFGKIFVTSKDKLQLNSTDQGVSVHAKTKAYVGAGGGSEDGFGVLADTAGVYLSKLRHAETFADPLPDWYKGVFVRTASLTLYYGESTKNSNIMLTDSKVEIQCSTGDCTINGKRILIGD